MLRQLMKLVDFNDHVEGFRVLGRIDDILLIEGVCAEGESHYAINDRSIAPVNEGVCEVDQETFYLVLANLAHYKYLLEQEDYEECGDIYNSFNDLVEAIYDQAIKEFEEVIDLGSIEYMYELVNKISEQEVKQIEFDKNVIALGDSIADSYIDNNNLDEFLNLKGQFVNDMFVKIYLDRKAGAEELAGDFASEIMFYICLKIIDIQKQVH